MKKVSEEISGQSWSTSDEITHLEKLGSHVAGRAPRKIPFKKVLESCEKKVVWEKLDKDKIMTYVKGRIEQEEKM